MSYCVRKFRVKKTETLDRLALESGILYSSTVKFFWRTVRKKGIWLNPSSLMRLYSSNRMHAHSADASVQAFFSSLKSWRTLRKSYPDAKPPTRLRKYFNVVWKNTAIRLRKGNLILSNGKGNEPVVFDGWKFETPVQCTLRWNGSGYEMICLYNHEVPEPKPEQKVLAVDLGQIHVATTSDGTIYNGRLLRSIRQWRSKKISDIQTKMDNKKKGSREWKRLRNCKRRFLKKVENRTSDILHKYTTRLVSTCKKDGKDTLVVGDLNGYRMDNDQGNGRNQENHAWLYSRITWMLRYKAEIHGLNFGLQNEAYSSQTCPSCGKRKHPKGREYRCKCGFHGHRDVVGAFNILKMYLSSSANIKRNESVVAAMRPASEIRDVKYQSYLRVA